MTTYRDAGVDIDAQDRALAQVKKMVRNTYTSDVLSDQGAFGGLFRPPIKGLKEPVLVASADGVGTKLKVAFAADRHTTVGRDLVHHCINDILVQGARPLFFLDYLTEDPDTGLLVSGPSSSPENTFLTSDGDRADVGMGNAMDQQIVWDLFTNLIEAAEVLGEIGRAHV